MNKTVYVDNSATTPVSDTVFEAMVPYLREEFGNPSSVYSKGRSAKAALDKARQQVATALGAEPDEIFFTGCGSESDNWALKSTMRALKVKGKTHMITTLFEHHAILHTAETL